MAIKINIRLQSPTIELPIKAQDASGAKDSLVVGFKRYEITEAQNKLDKLQEILSESQDAGSLNSTALDTFVKAEIVYIKQAKLELYDDETKTTKDLVIADTRTSKPNESLWVDADSCLDVLTSMYLSSAPWRLSLILAAQKALLNSDYSGAEVKN